MELRGLDKLPVYMHGGVERYVLHGILNGHFLTAVVSNRLVEAFSNADDINTAAMRAWVSWLYNEAPIDCWGSPEKVQAWIDAGGLEGIKAKEAAE